MNIYKDYAFSWNCVTLLLDWEGIKRDFKIKTISWNYRIGSCKGNFDKEREEFVVSNFLDQTDEEIKNEFFEITDDIYDNKGNDALQIWLKENGSDYIEYWQRKGKRTIDLNKYLLGIFIENESFNIYGGKGYDIVLNHPLFKGFVSRKESRDRHDRSMKKLY